MKSIIENSEYFGFVINISAYLIGIKINKKTKITLFNPLLIAIAVVILSINIFGVDYQLYNKSAKYMTYLLTPATISLAVPIYERLKILKNHTKPILIGILSGIASNFVFILIIAVIFKLSHQQYMTLLPKSISTAIGSVLSEEFGGIASITTAAIIITGITGGIISDFLFKVFKIKSPIAQGIALGSGAHAVGAAKAVELGELQSAAAGIAIAASGILTAILFNIFSILI